jgi:hypothetical protein
MRREIRMTLLANPRNEFNEIRVAKLGNRRAKHIRMSRINCREEITFVGQRSRREEKRITKRSSPGEPMRPKGGISEMKCPFEKEIELEAQAVTAARNYERDSGF